MQSKQGILSYSDTGIIGVLQTSKDTCQKKKNEVDAKSKISVEEMRDDEEHSDVPDFLSILVLDLR